AAAAAVAADPEVPPAAESSGGREAGSPLEVVRRLVARRAELPVASVRAGDRALSDLHLSSLAVGELVVEAARALGAGPPAAPTDFADASVAEIAAALEELAAGGDAREEAGPPPGAAPWVRPFVVDLVAAPPAGAWASEPAPPEVLAPPKLPGARRLRELLGAPAAPGPPSDPSPGTLVWLPDELDPAALELLLAGAHRALEATVPGGRPGRFVLVHSGVGAGFARSLHLERRGGEVLVLQVPATAARAAEWVAAELRSAPVEGYREVVFDRRGVRRAPVLRLWEAPSGRRRRRGAGPPLGADDVLLVSGGGRGIAAEAALALARRTGCALALLGRSLPDASPALARNLERLERTGVRFAYHAADVTDPGATAAAVARAEAELGPVTALLHAAGVNLPRPLSRMDPAALAEPLAPKVLGLDNLLAAVAPEGLRLLLAFGSLIARTGMPGEAHYALANEALARAVERFGRRHPGCRCLTLEWSVWSGVGMGERLAGGEAMRRRGIEPIPPDRGIEALLELLGEPGAAGPMVVTGRFGDSPTVALEPRELPFLRFLERP
ncbi:MAG TPA: SDR family NAD(P)-dependent oxidoreductase, partial [Thermoanaerobaculia bacterium]|nr:SDR family NAD(P)-dependent oxidoreductase [Thermoanaerobaculia bacterium]